MAQPQYTPMMMQYLAIKRRYPDTLIFFRLGDFYELFFDDAKIASKELSLVLTGKNAGVEERVPMCGIPHHASRNYIAKLVQRGYKVGIVEQLEDPALAKGIVERDVTQIFTPGAFIDNPDDQANYLVTVTDQSLFYVLGYCEVSTGELYVVNLEHDLTTLWSELNKLHIKEIILPSHFDETLQSKLVSDLGLLISKEEDDHIRLEYEPLLVDVKDAAQMRTIARLIHYLEKTQKRNLEYLQKAKVLTGEKILKIDAFSAQNLELVASIRQQQKFGTLYWLLDQTRTTMGSRLLQEWILKPSYDLTVIQSRQHFLELFIQHFLVREQVAQHLDDIYDLSRLIARISYGNANARDLLFLKHSLAAIPAIIKILSTLSDPALKAWISALPDVADVTATIEHAIDEDAPISVKEGGLFKKGYQPELDRWIDLSSGGKSWIVQFESAERARTGIKNLKVGFNKVFGYYIEISNGQLSAVKPEFHYERKQTLTNGERFITPELKDYEMQILNAEEKRMTLEYELFQTLRKKIATRTSVIQDLARKVAELDVLLSLSKVSAEHQFVKPSFNQNRTIEIIRGRHPVIEKVMKVSRYVVNDIVISPSVTVLLITGPNMGGKSTYMRQLSIIAVMAQMGCFVPAEKANLMLFDQIFTRIGASDDIVSGQSTFMVEMSETNYALRHATADSLLVFDEIGRGTATYDGMALAQAIIEYIASTLKTKTLFSTHYHELTALEKRDPSIQNIQTLVKEEQDQITFLYKVTPGAMNKSYGINVARLAKLPEPLLNRADSILKTFEQRKMPEPSIHTKMDPKVVEPAWVKDIKAVDPLTMTPMEALEFLYKIKKKM